MLKGFSISAPRVSLAELEAERASQSREDRRLAEADIYGQRRGDEIEETPELLQRAQIELQEELDALDVATSRNWIHALEHCPDIANEPDFRLMFLRSERFDTHVSCHVTRQDLP